MPKILRVFLWLTIFAVGLVLAAGVLVISVLLFGVWTVRSLYLKATGRRVAPFTPVFRRGQVFRTNSASGNVIDVEARQLP